MAYPEKLIKTWILGSSSKWRQEIFLKEFKSNVFAVADIDEKAIRHPQAEIMTQMIAKAKADEIIRRGDMDLSDKVLVSCDQVIRFQGEIREKPETREECRIFLRSYKENPDECVECINGICVYFNGHFLSHHEISKLTFTNLTDAKIEELVKLDDLMTCAGGFTICHMDIQCLQGSVYGIEGFPVKMVRELGHLCAMLQVHGKITHCLVSIGVLLNINDLYTNAHEEICKRRGNQLPLDLKARLLGLGDEIAAQRMIDTCNLNITVETYLEELYSVMEPMIPTLKFLPGAESLLNQLKTVNVGKVLVSRLSRILLNSMNTTVVGKQVMEVFGDYILCADDIHNASSSLDIYQVAIENLTKNTHDNSTCIKAERVVIFEDSVVSLNQSLRACMNVISVFNVNIPQGPLNCSLEVDNLLHFDLSQFVS